MSSWVILHFVQDDNSYLKFVGAVRAEDEFKLKKN